MASTKDRPKDTRVEPQIYQTPHGWRVMVRVAGDLKSFRFKAREATLEDCRVFRDAFRDETKRLQRREQVPKLRQSRRSLEELKRTVQERIDRIDTRLGRKRRPKAVASTDVAPQRVAADSTRKAIGRRLEALRLQCGWNQEDLAEQVDLERANVSRHINGRTMPRERNLDAYAAAFSKKLGRTVTVADLRGGTTRIRH